MMAKKIASDLRFYFGGYDPGTATTSVTLGLECEALDTSALTDAAERQLAGLRKDVITWAGLFDDSADAMDAAQAVLLGSGTAVVTLLLGTATGDRAYSGTAYALSNKPAANVAELVKLESGFKPDQSWSRGYVMAVRGTITGSAQTGTIDGTTTATGYEGYIHIFSFSGSGTATVRVVSRAGTGAWVNTGANGTLGGINGRSSFKWGSADEDIARYDSLMVNQDATAILNCAIILVRL